MFTGLIEEVGRVRWIGASKGGTQLQVAAPLIAQDLRKGDSVSVNGCCLTTTLIRGGDLTFEFPERGGTVATLWLQRAGSSAPPPSPPAA